MSLGVAVAGRTSLRPTVSAVTTSRTRVVQVLSLAAAVSIALIVIGASWLTQRGSTPVAPRVAPAVVVVAQGDTLWDLAVRVAPARDPRAEVSDLIRLNGLNDADIVAGQSLRTR